MIAEAPRGADCATPPGQQERSTSLAVAQARPAARPFSERERAVAIARHLHETERLTIHQIADRLGCSASTVAGYLADPDGSKARGYKSSYRGRCESCGARPPRSRA
jgi:AraC-like DNA-binding protein